MVDSYMVEVAIRGEVSPKAVEHARRRVAALEQFVRDPILFARVKLEQAADPARERPAIAEAMLDVNGTALRATTAEETMVGAVDALAARLRAKLEHFSERRQALRKRGSGPREQGEWRHGDTPTVHPPWFDRPVEERGVVRHKTLALRPMLPEEAAEEMRLLDHDFFLFEDLETEQEAVVWSIDRDRVGLRTVDGRLPTTLDWVVGEPLAAPPLDLGEATERLDAGGEPFVFFRDAGGHGTLLYRRYDGHYGLITPAEAARQPTSGRGKEATTMTATDHVLAEVTVEPFTPEQEHHARVEQAIRALHADSLIVTTGPMSTTIEGSLDTVLAAVARAHRAAGPYRVLTSVRIEGKPGGLHLADREAALAAHTA